MNQWVLKQYLEMIQDRVRSDAYERAIAQAVPGKVVLDLGSGPGFLSHLALKHGARRVYAIDDDAHAMDLATELARRFPDPDRFVPIVGLSLKVDLPEKVDVIVSEVLDSGGIGENAHISIADAARRFLVAGGQVIPHKLELFVAVGQPEHPGAVDHAWEQAGGRHSLPYGNFSRLLAGMGFSVDSVTTVTSDDANPRSGWVPWQTIDLVRNDFDLHTLIPLRAKRSGAVHGVGIAWRAHLTDHIILSTLPDSAPTHWKQGFIYFADRFDARIGDQFLLELSFSSDYSPGVAYWTRLHYASAADRERFIAGLPEELRPLVESGTTAVIRDGKPISMPIAGKS